MQQIRALRSSAWAWFRRLPQRTQAIIGAAVWLVLILACITANTGKGSTDVASTSTHTSTTAHATATPDGKATTVALPGLDGPLATGGQAVLGGTLDAFIAKYGTPHVRTQLTVGFHTSCSSGSADCEQVGLFPGTNSRYFVDTLSFSTPDSQPWASLGAAKTACRVGFPADAKLKSDGPDVRAGQTFGDYAIYTSASLAKIFPASFFTDAQGNTTTPGTFDVLILVTPSGTYSDCQIAAGATGA